MNINSIQYMSIHLKIIGDIWTELKEGRIESGMSGWLGWGGVEANGDDHTWTAIKKCEKKNRT